MGNRRECLNSKTFSAARGTQVLNLFSFQTPQDSERVATFAGADESAPFHRPDGIAIGGQRAYFFIVFQTPQNWIAAE